MLQADWYRSHGRWSSSVKTMWTRLWEYTSLCCFSFTPPPHPPPEKNKQNNKRARRSGGVAVLIHKTVISLVTHIESEHDNMICFKLAKDAVGSGRDLLFISVYVSPYWYKLSYSLFRRVSINFIQERRVLALLDYWWFKCTEQCRRW